MTFWNTIPKVRNKKEGYILKNIYLSSTPIFHLMVK